MPVDLAQLKKNGNDIYPITAPEAITGVIPTGKGGTGAASGALLVKEFSKNYTIPAGQLIGLGPPSSFITVPAGYETVGIVGFLTNHDEVYVVNLAMQVDSSQFGIALRNIGGSAHTTKLQLFVLFAKTGLVVTEME